jgi:hypothetical protein
VSGGGQELCAVAARHPPRFHLGIVVQRYGFLAGSAICAHSRYLRPKPGQLSGAARTADNAKFANGRECCLNRPMARHGDRSQSIAQEDKPRSSRGIRLPRTACPPKAWRRRAPGMAPVQRFGSLALGRVSYQGWRHPLPAGRLAAAVCFTPRSRVEAKAQFTAAATMTHRPAYFRYRRYRIRASVRPTG